MKLNSTQKIQLAGASLLLLCILPLPYGFYTIVRIVTTIISAYLAYEYYIQHKKGLAITFSIVAVLFQPFIKFTLGREIWLIVDLLVGGFLLTLVFKNKLIKSAWLPYISYHSTFCISFWLLFSTWLFYFMISNYYSAG